MKDNQIVFSEEEPTNVEHPIKGEVVFDIPDSSEYQEYGSDARFRVSREEDSKAGSYYVLTQIK